MNCNNSDKINKAIDLLKARLKKNTLIQSITPYFLMRKLELSEEEALAVCAELQREGLLKPRYTLYCPNCFRELGHYEVFNQVPEIEECMYCGQEGIEKTDNTFVSFDVVRIRPYRASEISYGNRKLLLSYEITCPVIKEEGYYIVQYEPLGIQAYAKSREEAINEFKKEFMMIWDIYGSESDDNLTQDAIQLKKRIKGLVKGEQLLPEMAASGHRVGH